MTNYITAEELASMYAPIVETTEALSSHISALEVRVKLLETQNAGLRKLLAKQGETEVVNTDPIIVPSQEKSLQQHKQPESKKQFAARTGHTHSLMELARALAQITGKLTSVHNGRVYIGKTEANPLQLKEAAAKLATARH